MLEIRTQSKIELILLFEHECGNGQLCVPMVSGINRKHHRLRRRLDVGWTVLNIDKLTYAANLRSLDAVARRPNYHFPENTRWTRRYDALCNDAETSSQRLSCPDCIMATPGYDFQEGQGSRTDAPVWVEVCIPCCLALSSASVRSFRPCQGLFYRTNPLCAGRPARSRG